MEQWRIDFQKGKSLLSHHDAQGAFRHFSHSLKECPTCECGCSSTILFYMGITLRRLGHCSSAVKLWISAHRIKKQKRIKKMINRYANGYGMYRQPNEEMDDRKAFFSIQIQCYLERKQNKKFSTTAERDVVFELLEDYWKNMQKSIMLKGKTVGEKREIFYKMKIPFPYVVLPRYIGHSLKNADNNSMPERCFCGSGLKFAMCCGRTPAVEELVNGVF